MLIALSTDLVELEGQASQERTLSLRKEMSCNPSSSLSVT